MRSALTLDQRKHYHLQPTAALQAFRQHMSRGQELHNTQQFGGAVRQFQQAVLIVRHLIDAEPLLGYQCYLKLYIAAHHNLAASLSALGKLSAAETTLKELHAQLVMLCRSNQICRTVKSQALGALDNALFALTTLLGRRGKLCELFKVIDETDQVAENTAALLLH